MLHQKASKSPISLLTSIQRLVYTHMLKSHTPVSVPPRCTRGAHTHAMANQKPVMKKKGCVRGVMYSKELLSGDPPWTPRLLRWCSCYLPEAAVTRAMRHGPHSLLAGPRASLSIKLGVSGTYAVKNTHLWNRFFVRLSCWAIKLEEWAGFIWSEPPMRKRAYTGLQVPNYLSHLPNFYVLKEGCQT